MTRFGVRKTRLANMDWGDVTLRDLRDAFERKAITLFVRKGVAFVAFDDCVEQHENLETALSEIGTAAIQFLEEREDRIQEQSEQEAKGRKWFDTTTPKPTGLLGLVSAVKKPGLDLDDGCPEHGGRLVNGRCAVCDSPFSDDEVDPMNDGDW